MNLIHKLFDEQYVIELFKKELLPIYSDFSDIKRVKIIPHKKLIWDSTYHVVTEFKTRFVDKNGKTKDLPIFCSAHSNEPRKNVYLSLQFLWSNNFANGFLTIPHPLFYSDYFKATFYRGVKGNNLYYYIRNKNYKEIEKIIPKAAKWFLKLHMLATNVNYGFNVENSRIETVFPGKIHILDTIKEKYPEYHDTYKKMYEILIAREEEFLNSTSKKWLIHGDAHPENIIKMSENKIAAIDFTDICWSDFARDLGCFTQQVEYMIMRKIGDAKFAKKMKDLFLANYFYNAKIKLDEPLKRRIETYYYWTAMRTATFHLLKDGAVPERARPLLEGVKKSFNI